jgi:hypothetical protein
MVKREVQDLLEHLDPLDFLVLEENLVLMEVLVPQELKE